MSSFTFPKGWWRWYPPGCDITSPHDALAVASGAYQRYHQHKLAAEKKEADVSYGMAGPDRVAKEVMELCGAYAARVWPAVADEIRGAYRGLLARRPDTETLTRWDAEAKALRQRVPWKDRDGRWVEDLSGVPFDDVDLVYLDYLLGRVGTPSLPADKPLARDLRAYRDSSPRYDLPVAIANRGRKTGLAGQGRVLASEQFDSLANYLEYRAQRNGTEDLDGFACTDGWEDRGLYAGRFLLKVEYRDNDVPDPSPAATVGRQLEWVCKGRSAVVTAEYKRLKERVRRAKQEAELAEGAADPSDLVLVPLADSLATLRDLGIRPGALTKVKADETSVSKHPVSLQAEKDGRTYLFAARWVPTEETEVVGGEEKPVFHDRWLWSALEKAHAAVRSAYHGLKAGGLRAACEARGTHVEGKTPSQVSQDLADWVQRERAFFRRMTYGWRKGHEAGPTVRYYAAACYLADAFDRLCDALLRLIPEMKQVTVRRMAGEPPPPAPSRCLDPHWRPGTAWWDVSHTYWAGPAPAGPDEDVSIVALGHLARRLYPRRVRARRKVFVTRVNRDCAICESVK